MKTVKCIKFHKNDKDSTWSWAIFLQKEINLISVIFGSIYWIDISKITFWLMIENKLNVYFHHSVNLYCPHIPWFCFTIMCDNPISHFVKTFNSESILYVYGKVYIIVCASINFFHMTAPTNSTIHKIKKNRQRENNN